MKLSKLLLFSLTLLLTLPAAPQQQALSHIAASAPTAVPPLIPYSGVVGTVPGAQPAASASITFLIYKDEQGGEPLFVETQTVALDEAGHYKAQLGATLSNGIPVDLFATGEARWLEVQAAGEAPQPRVLLVSVPYALKAADAATLGGLPPSAFALARPEPPVSAVSPAITPNATSNVTTTGGTSGYVPVFSGASTVVNSSLFVNGDWLGIGTATPGAALDVAGTALIEDGLIVDHAATFNAPFFMTPIGTATATTSYDSWYFRFATSAYDSATSSAVRPLFQLQAEAHNNNTPNPYATFNLLAATAPTTPLAETGFSIKRQRHHQLRSRADLSGWNRNRHHYRSHRRNRAHRRRDNRQRHAQPGHDQSPAVGGRQHLHWQSDDHREPDSLGHGQRRDGECVNGFDLGGVLFAFGSQASGNVYLGFAGNSSTKALQI